MDRWGNLRRYFLSQSSVFHIDWSHYQMFVQAAKKDTLVIERMLDRSRVVGRNMSALLFCVVDLRTEHHTWIGYGSYVMCIGTFERISVPTALAVGRAP